MLVAARRRYFMLDTCDSHEAVARADALSGTNVPGPVVEDGTLHEVHVPAPDVVSFVLIMSFDEFEELCERDSDKMVRNVDTTSILDFNVRVFV